MFGIGENSFLGVDIGTSTIKVAEIKIKDKKPILSNYAKMAIPISSGGSKTSSSDAFLAECLKKIIKEGDFSKGTFFMSVQSFGALVTLIDLPNLPEQDLEQAIQFEAHKYIPTSLDDVLLSWEIVRGDSKNVLEKNETNKAQNEKGLKALLVAVPKNRVIKYENIARKAQINLESIEIESFSLVRSLIGKDTGNFILLDIGSRVCNIILVEKGEIKVSRNIDAGGKDITKSIATGLSIDESRAESLKMSEMDFLGKESNVIFPSLDLIIGEIKRILIAYYKNDKIGGNINGLILSGGTAGLVGLDKYLSSALNVKIITGNPFGRVAYDNRLETEIKKTGTQYSVAIGLALKGLKS